MSEPLHVDDEYLLGLPLLDLCHHVRFQFERLSDKGFHAHRLSASFLRVWLPEEDTRDVRCASTIMPLDHLTLLGEEPVVVLKSRHF